MEAKLGEMAPIHLDRVEYELYHELNDMQFKIRLAYISHESAYVTMLVEYNTKAVVVEVAQLTEKEVRDLLLFVVCTIKDEDDPDIIRERIEEYEIELMNALHGKWRKAFRFADAWDVEDSTVVEIQDESPEVLPINEIK